jgi:hypothetical protein
VLIIVVQTHILHRCWNVIRGPGRRERNEGYALKICAPVSAYRNVIRSDGTICSPERILNLENSQSCGIDSIECNHAINLKTRNTKHSLWDADCPCAFLDGLAWRPP